MNEPAIPDVPSGAGSPAEKSERTPVDSVPATGTGRSRTDSEPAEPTKKSPVDGPRRLSGATESGRRDGQAGGASGRGPATGEAGGEGAQGDSGVPASPARKRRRRRGGRGRGGSAGSSSGGSGSGEDHEGTSDADGPSPDASGRQPKVPSGPTRPGRPRGESVGGPTDTAPGGSAQGPRTRGEPEQTEASRPRIGDTRPAPRTSSEPREGRAGGPKPGRGRTVGAAPDAKRPDGSRGASDHSRTGDGQSSDGHTGDGQSAEATGAPRKRRRRGGRGRTSANATAKVAQGREPEGVRSGVARPVTALTGGDAVELDDDVLSERRGKTRNGKPVGRYLMAVHVKPEATQIAILEGRSLIEHYVARPSDDIAQIHGNIYLGRVQNVLPGMEAAFIDIGTPKNAVLYRGDLHFDAEDIEVRDDARIEELLKPRQTVLCQVTKNPIMHKGARLTQEVSLPGRFVVLVPNSKTLGISKRLPDAERKRLRKIVDRSRPERHGVIVRTAAEGITGPEIERDLARLVAQWDKIAALAAKASAPALLYREPDMALRVIREEFSRDFRSVVIDDKAIFDDVHDYVASVSPALAERVSYFDRSTESLPLFERHHIVEQLRRALDRKVWLPSGGSLIIEHTEALTVIDVNTGKNVGKSSLEDTVFANNLEAAVEIARQLRLRDVGGIIVIDFIDMEVRKNRAEVVRVFREALARDKTRTQVFDISELGLVQMTRKRIGEGLLESFTSACDTCEGRGVVFDQRLFEP